MYVSSYAGDRPCCHRPCLHSLAKKLVGSEERLKVKCANGACGGKTHLAEGFDGTVFKVVEESVEESAASTAGSEELLTADESRTPFTGLTHH